MIEVRTDAPTMTAERPRSADRDAPVTQAMFRKVMGRFATGVTVVTARVDGEVFGMTANAFLAGSLSPPLCAISIARAAKMHLHLEAAGCFGISFLSEEQAHLSQHFAGRKVAGVEPMFRHLGGIPVLDGGVGAVAAEIADTVDCGDHTLFIGRITALEAAEHRPLLFYSGRYATLDREQRFEDLGRHSFW